MKTKVCFLPISSRDNPYQHLMMEGLRQDARLEIQYGAPGKILVALRTWLKFRPDVIHYDWNYRYFTRRYNWLTWINSVLFLLELGFVRYVLGCRIVWTMHNIRAHEQYYPNLEQKVQRIFASYCDWIRLFSPSSVTRASEYLQLSRDKFRVLPMGSYVGYYPNGRDSNEAREFLKLSSDELVLLYFGAIRPYKGIIALIHAFQTVSLQNWRLLVVGPPSDLKYAEKIRMEAEANHRIMFHSGYVPDNEVQHYMNASDIVVLPYHRIENSSSAVLAMGFAKPVMAPVLGGLSELLGHQSELLYEPGKLREALYKLNDMNFEMLKRIGETNREIVQRTSWKDYADFFA